MTVIRKKLLLLLLSAFSALSVTSCHNNFSERYHQLSRRCGVQADFPWDRYQAFEIRDDSGQTLTATEVQALSITNWEERPHHETAFSVTAQGCVLLPQGQATALEILDYSTKQYFLGEPPQVEQGSLEPLNMRRFPSQQLEPICTDEVIYSNGKLNLPFATGQTEQLNGLVIEVVMNHLNDASSRTKHLLLNPMQTLQGQGSFNLTFEKSGQYLVSLQSTNPFGELKESKKQCQITVLKEKPRLVIRGMEVSSEDEASYLAVHSKLFPSLPSPDDVTLFVCMRKIEGPTDSAPYCQNPENFVPSASIDFPEGGSYQVIAYVEDKAGNRSDPWQRLIKIDALPPRIDIKWSNPEMDQFLAVARDPGQSFSAHLSVQDDAAPLERMRNSLSCQIEFETKDKRRIPGDWVICRTGRCAGKHMGFEVPCDEELSFDFNNRAPWDYIAYSRMILKVKASDSFARTTSESKQIYFDPANMSQWKRFGVKELTAGGAQEPIKIMGHFRDDANRLLILTHIGVFLRNGDKWRNVSSEFNFKARFRYFTDKQHGYLWVLTDEGLYEYVSDDMSWKPLEVPSEALQKIELIKKDPASHLLWFGSLSKVEVPGAEGCSSWDMTQVLGESIYPFDHQALRDLHFVGNSVFAVTSEGYAVLKDCQWSRFFSFPQIGLASPTEKNRIHTDTTGKLWALRPGSAEFLNQDGQWESLDAPVPHFAFEAIEKDQKGQFWFLNRSAASTFQAGRWLTYNSHTLGIESQSYQFHGLFPYQDQMWLVQSDSLLQLEAPPAVDTIYRIQDESLEFKVVNNRIWLWGRPDMLARLTEDDANPLRVFAEIEDLRSITALYHDHDELSWVAGYTINDRRALFERKTDGRWVSHHVDKGLASEHFSQESPIRSIYRDQRGHVWIGTDSTGIARYDGSRWTYYYENLSEELDGVKGASSIVETEDGLLFAGDIQADVPGYLLFDGQRFRRIMEGLPNGSSFQKIVKDARGQVWGLARVDTDQNQLMRFMNGLWTFEKSLHENGISKPHTIGITETGDLWVAAEASRYGILRNHHWVIHDVKYWSSTWQANRLQQLHVDADGRMWFVDPQFGLRRTRKAPVVTGPSLP
jgi:hypothetical protein